MFQYERTHQTQLLYPKYPHAKLFQKNRQEVSRPFKYASMAGEQRTQQISRSNEGGQITQLNTVSVVPPDPQQIPQCNFQAYLRDQGITEDAIEFFKCLKWVEIGSRQRIQQKQIQGKPVIQKIGIAVRRVDANTLRVSIVWKRSSVKVNQPSTLIHKKTSYYGVGYRQSKEHSDRVGRDLTAQELAKINEALQNEANTYNPQIEALQNV